MARRAASPFVVRGLDEPLPGPREHNGPYAGTATVRHLPPGVCGADLAAEREKPAPGQLWARGEERVRIVRVNPLCVTYRELKPTHRLRRMNRPFFLRTSRRIVE